MAKIFKWLFISTLYFLLLIVIALFASNNQYILKAIRVVYLTGHKSAFLEDYVYFDNRKINIENPQSWPKSLNYNKYSSTSSLDSIHRKYETIAYIIIQNDSLKFEKYYQNHHENAITNSFSMAKSILSAVLGKALELGYIKSLDEKVITYLPELKGEFAEELTIKDLLTMRSGLAWEESYSSPFSITTRAYFDDNLSKAMLELPISQKPNQKFKYQSGDTQILAMVLSKVLPTHISEFTSTYFWKPMGAETTALWQYNKADGIEKTYCCIASTAKDFARFGKLYLNHGKWNGVQLLDSSYIAQSTIPASADSPNYGYSWWITDYEGKSVFAMNGHLGQFVIVIPDDNMIIVRLGHKNDGKKLKDKTALFYSYIKEAYSVLSLH